MDALSQLGGSGRTTRRPATPRLNTPATISREVVGSGIRERNPHIAFGVGEHYCLGAHVARLELNVIYRHLFPRLKHVELTGPISRLRSNLIGGVKRLPIRYELKPAD